MKKRSITNGGKSATNFVKEMYVQDTEYISNFQG